MATKTTELYRHVGITYARNLAEVLVKAHAEEYPKKDPRLKLVAAALYDELAAGTSDEWVPILEIVRNYPFPYRKADHLAWSFKSTRAFPLMGRLLLVVMSPEEFEQAVREDIPFVQELRECWVPLYDPTGYLEHLLGEPR